uniref:Cation-transporting ATPase n=1 Tax=Physcomitrium patens TaxID=3218 RepID=A0A7I4D7E7_PHYPA
MGVPAEGKIVKQVELYKRRSSMWRLDVWPFLGLYGFWAVGIATRLDSTDAGIVLAGTVVLHILAFLFSVWSVDFRCFSQASKVTDIHQADFCKVIPAKFSGSKEVVPLQLRKLVAGEKRSGGRNYGVASNLPADSEEIGFDFRKQHFIYSKELKKFCKLDYPTKDTFRTYMKNTGYGSEAKALAATEKWGKNMFEFPQPTFQKLMKEHCMEPFFVFQVFCVGLWCLDDYWYYSLFTLFMLVLFESTVVKSRIRTLSELRRVRVDTQILMVHRGGKWVKLSGVDLIPGDVVSIGRPVGVGSEERTVPADMLLIAGSVIANEALLTGESTPQWKGSISSREPDERLSIRRDKNHVLFGGTKILQHSPDKSGTLKAPDGGCIAIVLRTGFETSQGKLMRTILFSTERVSANNWESGVFILFLVFFALVAAGYVLKKGLEDPTRSKYKLLLNCSLIITSVIPPELPMELSIAVNTSLIALARKGIYCTEPFRIPFGGKVDVCCFDKTGTLTSDDMEFRGVVSADGNQNLETQPSKLSAITMQILAACHALVFVDGKTVGEARGLDRESVENDLTFAGFAVFACPLRHDSAEVLMELKNSSHILVMITGDQALTACHVASHVNIVTRPVLVLTQRSDDSVGQFDWISPDETHKLAYNEDEVFDLAEVYDLCIAGDGLGMLQRTNALQLVVPLVQVFARVAPDQKELILTTLKAVGRTTLMCGDGTNDVGALKQAHVGVALLNAIPPAKASTTSATGPLADSSSAGSDSVVNAKPKRKSGVAGSQGLSGAVTPGQSGSSSIVNRTNKVSLPASEQLSPSGRQLTPVEVKRKELKRLIDEMNEEGDGRAPVVKLGDASMAAPFTAKHSSVRPTTDIIRQGRSTLVTTLQMFKILGLNCLATAYVLSVMYLDGVKLGDMQATISGLFTASFFLFISHARPLDTLSAQRPYPNIFSPYVILSLLGQFSIHITFLIWAVNGAQAFMPEECVEPESEFSPNLVNTVSYMSNMMIQVATFAVNYIGHPFNQSIRENKPFYYALTSAAIFFTAVTSDALRSLNDWLRLVPLPKPFGHQLLFMAFGMMVSCYTWEHLLRRLFPAKMPLARPRQTQKASGAKKVQ